ncbi:MAG TPA: hydrogenase maturation nickel metallochaperone HypA [Chloroflexi bacterium]|nr:hydrogenase maturation nickel metallochaperone HypA [Chloroflexota bacterium]
MHELAVTQGMLSVVLEHAEKAGAKKVTDIYLVIGDLSTFVDDSVQFYFDFLSKGTLAEGATLHFRRVPATFRCWDCGNTFTHNGRDLSCPRCGGSRLEIIAGKEFYVESIEVE